MSNKKPLAIIDIGSNSVRLVIYDYLTRAPFPIFNEKVLCGLAKDLDITNKLNALGSKLAIKTIARFIKLCEIMNVKNMSFVATSAVRDAKDGNEFVEKLYKLYGIKTKILSGEKEAEFAGLGIISSIKDPDGMVADLGGGSLELINVKKNKLMDNAVSFPIGPLRLLSLDYTNRELIKIIDDYLKTYFENLFKLKKKINCDNLYLVGGIFRTIAKIHMWEKSYPLKVIHNYEIKASSFINTAKKIVKMNSKELLNIPAVSKKRINSLYIASYIAIELVKLSSAKKIIFSASGIREGFVYSKLNQEEKKTNPIISGCQHLISNMPNIKDHHYGIDLAKWMEPLFKNETYHEKKLREAACILSEISCFENTEYRADLAFRKIVDSSLIGIDHQDRVFIANSLYCRYKTYLKEEIVNSLISFISKEDLMKAQILGCAMRLGRSLSASNPGILLKISIKIYKGTLYLHLGKKFKDLNGEVIEKRMKKLSRKLGIDYVIT